MYIIDFQVQVTVYSDQSSNTLLATIKMKFVGGYRKFKIPQLRTTEHLTKRMPIQTIRPQLLMKCYLKNDTL